MANEQPIADQVVAAPAESFTLRAVVWYLFGSRRAILQVAQCGPALWVGLLFVLSAGFAREYDGADLQHEPWHLLLPLAASLGTSLILYELVYLAATNRGVRELRFARGYRTFLTFYWLTAPLAWLYAIPVERFMSAGNATAANLWFLAVVSVWRVLVITRALSVWLGSSFAGMLFIVMFFADSVVLGLAIISPKPIFDVMGGVRLSQPDEVVLSVMINVIGFGGLSWFVWLTGACFTIGRREPSWLLATADLPSTCRVSKPLWGAAILLLALGLALLPITQQEQRHRWQAERLLKSGALDEAIEFMSERTRDEFPPIWDPPPRMGYGEQNPSVIDVIRTSERLETREWVRELYVAKLMQNSYHMLRDSIPTGDDDSLTDFQYVLSVFERYVPLSAFDDHELHWLWDFAGDERIDDAIRDRLRAYLKPAKDLVK